ncbi:MAG: FAD:protein FMN transferase [Treponema sp.]|nr:FAD:protein FMN transferase [Treponema sp.]
MSACTRSASGQAGQWNSLGTVCSVNAFEDGTEKLYGEIAARLEEIDASFSTNKEHSSLSRINRAAGKERIRVEADVFFVIRSALDFAERTGGAFDPTIGPLVALWGICTDHPRVPSQDEIAAALSLVDWRKLSLDETDSSVFLEKEGMALDLGGIAKGYAADEIVRILQTRKVKRAVIDLGGNIYVFGMKADGSVWNVGIKNPADGGITVASVLSLPGNLSVVTSGNYERYFVSEGRRYHHIIDPKTGYPCENAVASVTIVLPSSMEADAMSTSAFLMGAEAFSQTFPKASFLFIYSDGHCVVSDTLAQSVK